MKWTKLLLLLLACFLLFSGCGKSEETKVVHRKETLVCTYDTCSSHNVSCKVVGYRYQKIMKCDIFTHITEKELDNE